MNYEFVDSETQSDLKTFFITFVHGPHEEVDTRRQLVAQRRGGARARKSELKVGGVMRRVHTGHAGGYRAADNIILVCTSHLLYLLQR